MIYSIRNTAFRSQNMFIKDVLVQEKAFTSLALEDPMMPV